MSRRVHSSKWLLSSTLATALLSVATPVAAQEAPSSPFEAGQKALHVAVGESFGIGGLFFRSPTSAWMVEAGASFRREELEFASPTGVSEATGTTFDLQLRAGLRSLRMIGESTLAQHTFGLVGGFMTGSVEEEGSESDTDGWNAGAFWDVGGEYLFSERFGPGVRVGVQLRYSRNTSEIGANETTASGFSFGTTPARLTGTLYF